MRRWKNIIFATLFFVAATAAIICIRRFDPGQNRPPHHVSPLDLSAAPLGAQPIPGGPAAGFAPGPSPAKSFRASRPHLADDEESLMLAAGAIKLWEPQALNGSDQLAMAASKVTLWEPITPVDRVVSFHVQNSLAESLAVWQRGLISGRHASSEILTCIRESLSMAGLTVEQCIQMNKLASEWEQGSRNDAFSAVAGIFASQAVATTNNEIRAGTGDRDKSMRLVAPLIRQLWMGSAPELQAVQQFYSLLADFEPARSADWFRGNIGQIEAMAKLGETDEALSAAAILENTFSDMGEAQRAKLDYDKGIIYFNLGRFSDAAKWLGPAAHSPGWSENRGDARALLIISLARTGDAQNAQAEEKLLRTSGDKTLLHGEDQLVLNAVQGNEGNR